MTPAVRSWPLTGGSFHCVRIEFADGRQSPALEALARWLAGVEAEGNLPFLHSIAWDFPVAGLASLSAIVEVNPDLPPAGPGAL